MSDLDGRSEMDLPLAAPVNDPLLRRRTRSNRLSRDPVVWSALLMIAGAASLFGWVAINGDLEGGQPKARVAIQIDREVRSEDIGLPSRPDEGETLAGAWTNAALNLPLPGRERVLSLSSDIDPEIVEESVYGLLPRIGADGRRPMDVYARPTVRFAGRTRARVAVVLTGLGLSDKGTEATIEAMPGAVTLAFVPYPSGVQAWAAKARKAGHETLLQLPQEPFGYPDNDPGPRAILSHLPFEENVERLRWSLGRMQGYVGVAPFMGERLALDGDALRPIIGEIARRGLLYLDDATNQGSKAGEAAGTIGATLAAADVRLTPGSAGEIDAQLASLEAAALETGRAVAIAEAHPAIVARISAWAADLEERGFLLAPVSALAAPASGTSG